MRLFSRTPAPLPATTSLALSDGPVVVRVRASDKARAYRLSITSRGEPVLTVPQAGKWRDAESFLSRHAGWLEARLSRRPEPTRIAAGALIPIRGVSHRIVPLGRVRGGVIVREGVAEPEVVVPGDAEHLGRRLVDHLKREARADLDSACARHALTLGVRIAALRLKDQSTRWGSCSSARILNFNWRLILAPPSVLDYVAAHEVAHLVEMNHSPAFWNTVERALPEYRPAKSWLKANGAGLMQIEI